MWYHGIDLEQKYESKILTTRLPTTFLYTTEPWGKEKGSFVTFIFPANTNPKIVLAIFTYICILPFPQESKGCYRVFYHILLQQHLAHAVDCTSDCNI